jgi:hypothetical protein
MNDDRGMMGASEGSNTREIVRRAGILELLPSGYGFYVDGLPGIHRVSAQAVGAVSPRSRYGTPDDRPSGVIVLRTP